MGRGRSGLSKLLYKGLEQTLRKKAEEKALDWMAKHPDKVDVDDVTGTLQKKTDEIFDKLKSEALEVQRAEITANKAIDTSKFRVISRQEQEKLQRTMGQTGKPEDIYVGTSASFSVNAYWRKLGGATNSGWVSLEEGEILSRSKQIDSWMKPLPYPVAGVRAVGNDWAIDNFGTQDYHEIARIINTNHPMVVDYGYFSFSTDSNRNIFMGRGIILHTFVQQGTEVYVTSNHRESEILGHRKTHTNMISAYVDEKRRLHINSFVD